MLRSAVDSFNVLFRVLLALVKGEFWDWKVLFLFGIKNWMWLIWEVKFENSDIVLATGLLFSIFTVFYYLINSLVSQLCHGILSLRQTRRREKTPSLFGYLSHGCTLSLLILRTPERTLGAISQAYDGLVEIGLIFVLLVEEHVHRVVERLVFLFVHVQAPALGWIFKLALIDHDAIRFAPYL